MFCAVIKGIGSATLSGTLFAMIADTIEYGHWKPGTRVEGMLYSSTPFGAKVGAGVGGAVALAVIGAVSYTHLQTVSQTEEAAGQEDGGSPENNCVSFNSGRSRYGWWRGSDKYTEEEDVYKRQPLAITIRTLM